MYLDAANTKSYSYSENLFTNSNDFTVWTKQSSTATSLPVIALNTTTTVSPDGTFNANYYTTDYVGGSTFYSLYRGGITISSATSYIYSVYMKAKEVAVANLSVFDGTYNSYIATNLSTGAVTFFSAGTSSFTSTNYTINPVGNGWYRAVFPFSHSLGGSSFQFKIDLGTTNTSSGIYLYGAQIQKSPYIGSYTPTTASAITPSTTWIDLSGQNNTATLSGPPNYNSSNNTSFSFNGTTQFGTVSNNFVTTATYTKCIWFNCTNFSLSNNLLSGNTIFWLAGGNRVTGADTSNGNYSLAQSNSTVNLNTWYQAALTYNNSGVTTATWKIYINGVLDSTTYAATSPSLGGIQIGAFGSGNFFSGQLALPMIYNRALSDAEIYQNFQAQRDRFGI
jgi:hypothetical protein